MLDKLRDYEMPMPHGRVPRELLEVIRELYNVDDDKEFAMEVALAAIEYSLCGCTSFEEADRKDIIRMLRPYLPQMNHNLDSYNNACEDKAIDLQLEDIARLYWKEKCTQKEIGVRLNTTQQAVSKRLKMIRQNYPELVARFSK